MNYSHLAKRIILWGGTGQAKVIRPIIQYYGSEVIAVIDDTPNLPSPFPDVPIYHGWKEIAEFVAKDFNDPEINGTKGSKGHLGYCVTIGNPHSRARIKIHDFLRLTDRRAQLNAIIHPSAIIDKSVELIWDAQGAQILAGAIIQPEVKLGKCVIINTGAQVDHECVLEEGVEVGPGAVLCGLVHVEACAWIGAGATVLPRLRIGHDSIVGAGAVVTEDVPPNTVVVGVPAKKLIK